MDESREALETNEHRLGAVPRSTREDLHDVLLTELDKNELRQLVIVLKNRALRGHDVWAIGILLYLAKDT